MNSHHHHHRDPGSAGGGSSSAAAGGYAASSSSPQRPLTFHSNSGAGGGGGGGGARYTGSSSTRARAQSSSAMDGSSSSTQHRYTGAGHHHHSPSLSSLGSSSSAEVAAGASKAHAMGLAGGAAHPPSDDTVPMLGGETIEGVYTDVTYLSPYTIPSALKGTLTVTNYKLYFKTNPKTPDPIILDVPLGFISRLEKMGGQRTSTGENAYGLEIVCKDIRTLRFGLSKSVDGGHSRKDIFETIRYHCFPLTSKSNLFAYTFTGDFPVDGWQVYDAVSELKRQGLPNESWKISRINDQYDVCDTYPRIFGVPKLVTDEELHDVAKFRSKGRLPVLSWMHPDSLATICRCAQPLVGVSGNRSRADEKYVQSIMEANAQSHRVFIMDARPKVNSMVNIVNGGGYENEDVYQNAELVFLDIHNIHVMRESLRRVKDICFPVIDDQRWLSNVDNTHWLDHLHCILSGAVRVADKVENSKTSVIVHCSDGWDRTSQLTSLAMLLLDPFYRTLRGFQVLIEKEWLGFGHKFAQRVGHGADKHNDGDRSPVFLQFVDCVWQVTSQFPHSFEFNEYFLTFVLDHLYSCLFGTFLYNSDKERRQQGVQTYTQSLWSFISCRSDIFTNPLYNASAETARRPIFPVASVRYLKLWTGYYCRWNPRMRPQDSVRQRQTQLLAIKQQLRAKVNTLKKELEHKKRNNSSNAARGAASDENGAGGGGGADTAPQTSGMIKYDTVNI